MLAVAKPDLVNGHDVRVLQAGGRGGLGPKSLHQVGPGQRAGEEELHREVAVQAKLPGAIDHAHAAAGDFF